MATLPLPPFVNRLISLDLPWIDTVIVKTPTEEMEAEGMYSAMILIKDSMDTIFMFCVDEVPKVIKRLNPTMLGLSAPEILGNDDIFTDYSENEALEKIIELI